ncbi:MAG: protein kinase [Chloroflexota bacterium]
MQNFSGRKLGNYELRERLGRGGMAEVYRAYQVGMDRDVAVKIMLGHLAEDDTFIKRFKREARAVGRLRHPHIINIFDFGIENDVFYMVMEYLADGNLKEYIDENGRLSLTESLTIARDLADALDYAHGSGMIHRDLKPANIMFVDKSKQNVVLTDFGIAQIIDATALTGTGMSVGTPSYMSPEAGSGDDTDERTDIYAMGIILYEMLVGKVPYNADTPLAVIMKHINAPLPTRDDYGDLIPPDVENIMLRCLAKVPEARFASAVALRDALTTALDKQSTAERATSAAKATEVSANNATQFDTIAEAVTQPGVIADNMTTPLATPKPQSQETENQGVMRWVVALIAVVVFGSVLFFTYDAFFASPDTPADVVITESATETTSAQADVTPSPEADTVVFESQLGGELPPNPEANLSMYSNISEILNEAETLVFEGNLEGAIAQVEAILEDEPENAEALFAKARLYSYRWDEDNIAGETAQQLIDLQPDSPWGYIALADSYLNYPLLDEEGSVDAARDAIQTAIDIDPENPHALWRLANLGEWELQFERYTQAEAFGASGADFILSIARFFSGNRDYLRAIPYWESYYRGSDTAAWTWSESFWELTEALIRSGDARAAYDLLLESPFPDIASDASTYGNMAYIAFMPGEYEQAREWADAALAFSSEDDANAARWVLAFMAFEVDEDEDSAVEQLIQLAEEDAFHRYIEFGTQTDAYLQSARYMATAGRDEEAIEFYSTLVELNSGVPFFFEERADAYLRLGENELARADLQTALAIEPDPQIQQYYRDRIIELGPAGEDD